MEPSNKFQTVLNETENPRDKIPVQIISDDDSDEDSDDYKDFHNEPKQKMMNGGSSESSSLNSVDLSQYKDAIEKIRINKKMNIAIDKKDKRLDDEYYKVKKIGQGSFGKVYLVSHIKSHLQRAVKQIKKGDYGEELKKKREI